MNARSKKPNDKRTRIVVVIAAVTGCVIVGIVVFMTGRGGPSAPALRPEPVYHNAREGFRFVAPEGWTQVAKAELPPGPAEKERLLVRYQAASGDAAALEATLIDLPESADLAAYLAAPSYGVADWKPIGPPESLTIHDVRATRFTFRSPNLAKESVAFRRRGRVYFFTITTSPAADRSRDLARKAVESVVWTK